MDTRPHSSRALDPTPAPRSTPDRPAWAALLIGLIPAVALGAGLLLVGTVHPGGSFDFAVPAGAADHTVAVAPLTPGT